MLTLEEIKKALIEMYGEITDRGCFVNGKWMSLEQIIEILKNYAG